METNLIFLTIIVLLISAIAWQQWIIQTLVNKLMSRSYFDYQVARKEVGVKKQKPIEVDQEPAEDFGTLADLSSNII